PPPPLHHPPFNPRPAPTHLPEGGKRRRRANPECRRGSAVLRRLSGKKVETRGRETRGEGEGVPFGKGKRDEEEEEEEKTGESGVWIIWHRDATSGAWESPIVHSSNSSLVFVGRTNSGCSHR
ncbi:hypothetical protein INR49_031303, partial [Caranx melampygus]